MIPPRPTLLAHQILTDAIRPGDTVIDATAGHGHDTLFLAGRVGDSGRVLAFDVQESAIQSARTKVETAGLAARVNFYQMSHARMAEYAQADSVRVVMFNLGYLPGADHDLSTMAAETLSALAVAAALLQSGGLLSVVCYPGHSQGATEATEAEIWLSAQCACGWRVGKYAMLGTLKPAPYLLVARKP
jgi:tRNA1(Val) A37 N6-methylase TrmN6